MGGDGPGAARPPGRRTRGPRAAGARPSGRTAGAGPARYRRAGPPAPPARPGPRRSPAGRCPACRRRRSRAEGRGRRSDPAWVRDPDRGRRSARARGWATGPGRRSARARGGLSGRVRAAPARPGGVGRPRLRRGLRRRGPVRAARLGRLIPPVRCAGCDLTALSTAGGPPTASPAGTGGAPGPVVSAAAGPPSAHPPTSTSAAAARTARAAPRLAVLAMSLPTRLPLAPNASILNGRATARPRGHVRRGSAGHTFGRGWAGPDRNRGRRRREADESGFFTFPRSAARGPPAAPGRGA